MFIIIIIIIYIYTRGLGTPSALGTLISSFVAHRQRVNIVPYGPLRFPTTTGTRGRGLLLLV